MKTIERREIDLELTEAHPLNREFPTHGREWDEFLKDVAARGIQEDLTVRLIEPEKKAGKKVVGHRYQVLRGHRRRLAGLKGKVGKAWALVVEAGDEEAFDAMWEGNLHRENVNPADEARAVQVKLRDFGHTVEELAKRWNRSVQWIENRQALLELGDEVLEAVALPERERLTMGAVEEILRVPAELRPEAVQMVLHPVFQMDFLSADQARDMITNNLLEPKVKAAAWEAVRKKLGQAVRKELETLCLPKKKGDMMIQTKGYEEGRAMNRGYEDATKKLELGSVLPDAPETPGGLRWLHLAVKHSVGVLVVPGEEAGSHRAIVNTRMILDAEAAMAEAGGGNWLVIGKGKCRVSSDLSGGEDEEEKRVEKAKADIEAGFDTSVNVEERPETVIEQGMQHLVMIDMGAVEVLGRWAADPHSPDKINDWIQHGFPEYVPGWAREEAMRGEWRRLGEIVQWVLGLKG